MSVGLLKQEALRLAPEERAQLIDALWDSLAGPERAAVDAAWAAESERRIDSFEQGGMVAEEGPESLNKLHRKFGS
jgi:putative addiction module component (TIGR02574 family)